MNELKKTEIKMNFEIDEMKLTDIKPVNDIIKSFFSKYPINKINNYIMKIEYNNRESIRFLKTIIIYIDYQIDLSTELTDVYYRLLEYCNDIVISNETDNETVIETD